MMDYEINDSTPLAMLTVGQQKQIIRSTMQEVLSSLAPILEGEKKRFVYATSGVMDLLKISRVQAKELMKGVLKPAIHKNGRRVYVDAEQAIRIFDEYVKNK